MRKVLGVSRGRGKRQRLTPSNKRADSLVLTLNNDTDTPAMATVKIETLLIRVKHRTTSPLARAELTLAQPNLAKPISSRIKTQARE